MAKKTAPESDYTVEPAAFLSSSLLKQKIENGRQDRMVCGDAEQVAVGLPLHWPGTGPVERHHALGLRWIYGCNVFALGRMHEVVGVSGSFKSTFLFENYRWHVVAGGAYRHHLAEAKDTPDVRRGVIYPWKCHDEWVRCQVLEEWQIAATDLLKTAHERFAKVGECPFPLAIGTDSLLGVTNEASAESVLNDGFAKLQFAKDANLIKIFCQAYFPALASWPFSFIGVNHLKEKPRDDGRGQEERELGGSALKFHATTVMRLSLVNQGGYQNAEEEGRQVEVFSKKSSSGADKNSLKVDVCWRYLEDGQQVFDWKWHDASVLLLVDAGEQRSSISPGRRNRVRDVLDLGDVNKTHRTASSKRLGLVKASWKEIGEAIEQDIKLRTELDNVLGISQRASWRPGVPYKQQCDEALAALPSNTAAPQESGTPQESAWGPLPDESKPKKRRRAAETDE